MRAQILHLDDPKFKEKVISLLREKWKSEPKDYYGYVDDVLKDMRDRGAFSPPNVVTPIDVIPTHLATSWSSECPSYLMSHVFPRYNISGAFVLNTYVLKLPVLYLDALQAELLSVFWRRGLFLKKDIRRFLALCTLLEGFESLAEFFGESKHYSDNVEDLHAWAEEQWPEEDLPLAEELGSEYWDRGRNGRAFYALAEGDLSFVNRRPLRYKGLDAHALMPREIWEIDPDFTVYHASILVRE